LEEFPLVDTKLEFQGEVKLPGTKYDAVTKNVGLTVRVLSACTPLPVLSSLHARCC
jgi:hypothetical protein